MKYIYIAGTVLFTVYGQLIVKWRLGIHGALPETFGAKLYFLLSLFGDFYILSGFGAAFVSSLFWMAAMTTTDLGNAYPIITGGLVLLSTLLAIVFFGEVISLYKFLGISLILLGVYLIHTS